ncbi:MAG: hypothetical protein CMM39_12855 [Rhodospirillaceae bacterium]|nr:hypothetical protein [Rhodospirillaceae bacterium]MDG1887694.1 hypothetical protein [Alphaproteobacteria bacterium]
MAVFPDRWGVVAAIAGVGAIYGFFGAVGLSDFSITAIKPTLFGTLCIIACIISWKVHRRLKKDQMLSMTERTDAILNASKNDIEKLEKLLKTDPFRDTQNPLKEDAEFSKKNK